MFAKKLLLGFCFLALLISSSSVLAQEMLPADNGPWTYHTEPYYRPSDEHPLRWVAYAVHPVGWVARELVVRPVNYLISSTEFTRSLFGYREPYDYRTTDCFSSDATVPDCRTLPPYNYGAADADEGSAEVLTTDAAALPMQIERNVYFPDVNFDFDRRALNDLGKGRVRQIARLLQENSNVKVVLEGHTDYKGSDTYNEKLGNDRSNAVRQELLALGISEAQLSSVSFGKAKPVFSEGDDWARAVNRRVEVHVAPAVETVKQ